MVDLRQAWDDERDRARKAVRKALYAGRLAPIGTELCSDCGDTAAAYHHHLGYAPEHELDLEPLCKTCHVRRKHTKRPQVTVTIPPGEQMLRVETVAARLAVSRNTVYRLLRSGQLVGRRIGGTKAGWRVSEAALAAFLAAATEATARGDCDHG